MRRALAVVALALVAVSPAAARSILPEPREPRTWLTVDEALRVPGPTTPVVIGAFVWTSGVERIVYACARELQSYPPQCGRRAMRVVGMDFEDRRLEEWPSGDPRRRRWRWLFLLGEVRAATPEERTWRTDVVFALRERA